MKWDPMSAPRSVDFGIVVSFVDNQAILAVSGEVDMLTAPTLHAAITALVEQGHAEIVLDFAALTFMDASGLRVIADTSQRLGASGRMLTVRSTPPLTSRILHLTRLDEIIRLEAGKLKVVAPLVDGSVVPLRIGIRPTDDVIDAALRRVTELVSATLQGADGVSITLDRNGRLSTVAASNETVMKMDDHQYQSGEGPCLSAAATGRGFHIESLADETRWPTFVPLAMEEGIASILSTPLTTVERSLGALNIYSNTDRAFGPQQHDLAALFASQASGILGDAGADDEQMSERLANALTTRQTIARAQGVLMSRENLSAAHAASSLQRSARAGKVTVALYAARVVATTHDAHRPQE
jgi:anti-anti-sigma factor